MGSDAHPEDYIPALGHAGLTRWFDLFVSVTLPEKEIRAGIIEQAQIQAGDKVLDLGCGTGSLLIFLKQQYPEVEAHGVDGDKKILEIAKTKINAAGLEIQLTRGMVDALPYPDVSFDRVLSSLVFHHLNRKNKQLALKEAFRVLRPGGEIHLADTGKPHTPYSRFISLIMRRLEETADNIDGMLPQLMEQAGFTEVEENRRLPTIFGTLSFYKGKKGRLRS